MLYRRQSGGAQALAVTGGAAISAARLRCKDL
jgi:hypothetical protein